MRPRVFWGLGVSEAIRHKIIPRRLSVDELLDDWTAVLAP